LATLVSTATTDLGSVNQAYVSITGTTAITSFSNTAQVGQVKFLTFIGILTLTNSASLILPGGANITTGAGDTHNGIFLAELARGESPSRAARIANAGAALATEHFGPATSPSIDVILAWLAKQESAN
jgi:pyridoxal/pyridoxine/pyridoxamine kinase